MPWKSDKQRRWGNSLAGKKAMGADKVEEFNDASKGMDMPEEAPEDMPMSNAERNKMHQKNHPHISRIHDPKG